MSGHNAYHTVVSIAGLAAELLAWMVAAAALLAGTPANPEMGAVPPSTLIFIPTKQRIFNNFHIVGYMILSLLLITMSMFLQKTVQKLRII